MRLNVRLTRQKFDESAACYEDFSSLQRKVGQRLLKGIRFLPLDISAAQSVSKPKWLDVGCGPGSLWQLMGQKQRASLNLLGADLSFNMLRQGKQEVPVCQWVNADMDQLPIAQDSLNGIVSSFAIHWSSNSVKLLSEFNRCLKDGGLLALAFPVQPSFSELEESWRSVGGNNHRNNHHHEFPSTLDVWQAMQHLPFAIQGWQQTVETMRFATVTELVKTLRGLGVTNSRADRDPGLMTPRRWSQFIKAYAQYKTEDGQLPLSYSVLWIYAKKLAR